MVKTLTQLKRILIFAFVLFAASILVSAHSLYLFGISLDFDKDLKSNVIKSAQEFLKTGKEPLSFDLDKGLIMAHFEPEQKHYVEVNPADFKVYGMRDENLKHTVGEKKLTKEQGPEIAKKFFDTLPGEVKSELKYGSEASEVDGTYFYKWFRYVNGILVAGEDFMVNVDAVNGNIIAWRLPIFDYPKNTIDTAPAITKNVAKKVAELSFNAPSVTDFKPYLIININEPVWVIKLQGQFYPFFVGVSAKDGSIPFSGTLPGEIPQGYAIGENIQVLETGMIKEIYNSK